MDVGDVRLAPGDAVDAADASRRVADARRATSLGAARAPGDGAASARRARRIGGQLDGLDDLLVAGAAAQVAGEALLDLGPRRMRRVGEQRLRRHAAGPGCRTRTGPRRCRGTPPAADASRSPTASPSTVVTVAAVRLGREHEARVDAPVVDEHRARAALADEAALLRAGQAEVVAQDLEQRVLRLRPRA